MGRITNISLFILILTSCSYAAEKVFTVTNDGSGDFMTIQEAVDAAPDNHSERTVLHIKPGRYSGPFLVPANKRNITFEGENAQTTILTWDRSMKDPLPPGADGFNPGVHIRGDDFHAENLTFENTAGDRGQALALRVDGDRAVFANCRILGWQDTLMLNYGRNYFKDCYIEGRVDFIFGNATAVFGNCHIHSRNGGFITAPSTPAERPFGFVFLHCRLTGDDKPWADPAGTPPSRPWSLPNTYLGRPWRPYGNTVFIECEMDNHIRPEGWDNWGNQDNEKSARFAEYKNNGPGAHSDKRVNWARQLTQDEAASFSITNILSGTDNWNPSSRSPGK